MSETRSSIQKYPRTPQSSNRNGPSKTANPNRCPCMSSANSLKFFSIRISFKLDHVGLLAIPSFVRFDERHDLSRSSFLILRGSGKSVCQSRASQFALIPERASKSEL